MFYRYQKQENNVSIPLSIISFQVMPGFNLKYYVQYISTVTNNESTIHFVHLD